MLDHQAEVAGAYKSSKSKFGASSAYGQDLVLDIGLLDPDQDELLEEPDN